MKALHIVTALLLALTIAAVASADTFGPGKHVVNGLIVTVPTGSSVTIELPTSVVQIGPTDDPVVPPPPLVVGSLTEVVEKATAAIPAYGDKDKHQRTVAFTLTFLSQAIPSNSDPSAEARSELHKACDLALGADAAKWSPWWVAVDSKTASMTNAQYKAAVPLISTAVTGSLENVSGGPDLFGVPNYGLPEGFLAELFKILLPILLKLLTGLI
jgi:hypothetical protein|tara:strand:- start:12 stop:653 length:642 start_codon:yes stop_codon:yes gene_type:complete